MERFHWNKKGMVADDNGYYVAYSRLAAAEQENTRLSSLLYGGRCVYCGEIVGAGTLNQDLSDEVLKEHVKTCAAHPYVQMKERAEKAESAQQSAKQSAKEQFVKGLWRAVSICYEEAEFYVGDLIRDEAIREAAKERGNE